MPTRTHAIFVLDRSGSMQSCRDATINGFNEQLATLRATEGAKIRASLIQFDFPEQIETLYERLKVAEAPDLNHATYEPRGNTAMLDAVGRAIALGDRDEKADAIVLIVLSDGLENASRVETWQSIAARLKDRLARNWTVVYIGADHDLTVVSDRMGLEMKNMLRYEKSERGTAEAFLRSSLALRRFAVSGSRRSERFFEEPDDPKGPAVS